jgi:lysophospholipase L1-like esterase
MKKVLSLVIAVCIMATMITAGTGVAGAIDVKTTVYSGVFSADTWSGSVKRIDSEGFFVTPNGTSERMTLTLNDKLDLGSRFAFDFNHYVNIYNCGVSNYSYAKVGDLGLLILTHKDPSSSSNDGKTIQYKLLWQVAPEAVSAASEGFAASEAFAFSSEVKSVSLAFSDGAVTVTVNGKSVLSVTAEQFEEAAGSDWSFNEATVAFSMYESWKTVKRGVYFSNVRLSTTKFDPDVLEGEDYIPKVVRFKVDPNGGENNYFIQPEGVTIYTGDKIRIPYSGFTKFTWPDETTGQMWNVTSSTGVWGQPANGKYYTFDEPGEYYLKNSESGVKLCTFTVVDNALSVRDNSNLIDPGSANKNEPMDIILGDIDYNGSINSADTLALQQHMLGIKTISVNLIQPADTNWDSSINSDDMLVLQQHMLGVKAIDKQAVSADATTPKVLIMGDSLTQASQWRSTFAHGLVEAGAECEFVGLKTDTSELFDDLENNDLFRKHCGYGGYSTGPDKNEVGNLYNIFDDILSCDYDVVILMIGTNDYFGKGSTEEEILNNYWNLVNRIYDKNPNAIVYCASCPPLRGDKGGSTYAGNLGEVLPDIVNYFYKDGKRCFYINMHDECGIVDDDFGASDGTHPLASGYIKIGNVFLNHIKDTILDMNAGKIVQAYHSSDSVRYYNLGVKNY